MLNIGSDLLGSIWDDYKNVLSDAHATFNQKIIIWLKQDVNINRYQEDLNKPMIAIELKVLLNYNFKRSWPVNISTDSGEDDEQNIQLFINKEYLRQNNLLDINGNFDYDSGNDLFIIDGTKYKSFGDTAAAQMYSDAAFITIVVKRIQLETGSKK